MSSTNPQHRLLRLRDVLDKVGLSKSTVYAMIRRKEFPKPVHLGCMATWVESEIDAWITSRIDERDQAA
ncbi:helix-turn-helix transcriptional regulator [Xanthomonas arboricola]|uniref:helix-turn-helix transcriptional regulator n=1 Tax=Xanthomonas arboricola TaxID=56448 RepID=UPI0040406E97